MARTHFLDAAVAVATDWTRLRERVLVHGRNDYGHFCRSATDKRVAARGSLAA